MSRNAHARLGSAEARNEVDGLFYSSVGVQGDESEGYTTSARIRGPIPMNPSLSSRPDPRWKFDTPRQTITDSFKIFGPKYDLATNDYEKEGINADANVFGNRRWQSRRRAEIAGASMVNRIQEGRNVRTGRSDNAY